MSKINKRLLIMMAVLIIIIVIIILLLNIFRKNSNKEDNLQNQIGNATYEKGPADLDKNVIMGKNAYNEFEFATVTEEELITKYLEDYKKKALDYPEEAYNSLDILYRNNRFGSIDNYKKYIEEKREIIANLQLTKYLINSYDDYEEYICVDQYDSYYIFRATAVMQYTLILDTYTIDLPEFTEKYNKASEQEKVALNINKVITALNEKDYKYIYSKLADSFKNNYFKDEESLKEYLVNNLFDKNIVEFEEFAREGTLYTYKIKLTKIISEDEKEKYYGKNAPMEYVNVVMQLNEGTDFVMSFSIEE